MIDTVYTSGKNDAKSQLHDFRRAILITYEKVLNMFKRNRKIELNDKNITLS